MKRIRTRYAPSPTGYLHIGGARTALYSYLFAKHFDGDFVVRIEDTDVKRNVADGEKSQLENLKWLGIVPDESPSNPKKKYGKYRQSEKLEHYNKIVDELLEKGLAYKAYETSEELTQQREAQIARGIPSFRYDRNALKLSEEEIKKRDKNGDFTIRIALPENKWYAWKDLVRGKISVNTNDIGDFVIKKRDGYPTYNFAVVVDDHDMEMTHILRGEEHITNTPKQLAVYDLLGWEVPEFGHLTIITNMEGKKLSKRDTSLKQFIEQYKDDGYHPQAILNFLTLLGWTHPQAKEKMSKEELIKSFDTKRLSKSPSKFDIRKMDWFSKEYIKNEENSEIKKHLSSKHDAKWLDLFIDTYKQSASTYTQIQKSLSIYDDHSVKSMEKNEVVKTFASELNKVKFTIDNIKDVINKTKEITGAKGKNLFMPIRLVTTYQEHGPELAKAIYLFGEKTIKARLK